MVVVLIVGVVLVIIGEIIWSLSQITFGLGKAILHTIMAIAIVGLLSALDLFWIVIPAFVIVGLLIGSNRLYREGF